MSETNPAQMGEALRRVVREIEQGAATLGWDRPPAIYALVPTTDLMNAPGLPPDVLVGLEQSWDGSDSQLSAVLQDSLGEDDLENMLPRLAWPDTVSGAAVTVERIIVPPEVEDEAPEDPDEALEFISNHPARTDVRLIVGVTRAGDAWCAVRARPFDDPERVGQGENLVPSLVEALRLGFLSDDELRRVETDADSAGAEETLR